MQDYNSILPSPKRTPWNKGDDDDAALDWFKNNRPQYLNPAIQDADEAEQAFIGPSNFTKRQRYAAKYTLDVAKDVATRFGLNNIFDKSAGTHADAGKRREATRTLSPTGKRGSNGLPHSYPLPVPVPLPLPRWQPTPARQ